MPACGRRCLFLSSEPVTRRTGSSSRHSSSTRSPPSPLRRELSSSSDPLGTRFPRATLASPLVCAAKAERSMSSAADAISTRHSPVSAPTTGSRDSPHTPSRPTGKGRRRRAAAEQRRLELQQWGQLEELLCSEEQAEDAPTPSEEVGWARSYEGPRQPGSRRQQRRASRRALAAAEASALEDYFEFEYSRAARSLADGSSRGWGPQSAPLPLSTEQEELELALAVSLSLSDSGSVGSARAIQRAVQGDLSYENLVNLDAVPLTLPAPALGSLVTKKLPSCSADEMCPICLAELVEGDSALVLPCSHTFHETCGSEWLLRYSKCCPVCKQEVQGSGLGGVTGDRAESVTSDDTGDSDE